MERVRPAVAAMFESCGRQHRRFQCMRRSKGATSRTVVTLACHTTNATLRRTRKPMQKGKGGNTIDVEVASDGEADDTPIQLFVQ